MRFARRPARHSPRETAMKQTLRGKTWRLAVAATLAGSVALTACSGGAEETTADRTPAEEPSLEFTGPNGETPESLDQLELTDEEIAKVQAGNYKAAFVWHESSALVAATEKGGREGFERLGIEVVATAGAGLHPA